MCKCIARTATTKITIDTMTNNDDDDDSISIGSLSEISIKDNDITSIEYKKQLK